MALSTVTHQASSTSLSPVDLQKFEETETEMHFPESSFQTSAIAQERAKIFFQHLEKKLPMQDGSKSPLQEFLEHISQNPFKDEISRAFFKQRDYFLRLFSDESWEEWTENRTALGKVAFLFRDYMESSRRTSHFTQGLDASVVQQANVETDTLLQTLEQRSTATFQPLRCFTGLLGGVFGSLLTKNPFLLILGVSECLPKISAQREIGEKFLITKCANCQVRVPIITSLENGHFVVLWNRNFDKDWVFFNIYAQIFDNHGTKWGNRFQINMPSNKSHESNSITSFNNSNFLVIWSELTIDTSNHYYISDADIFGQLFTENGTKRGSKFQVNTYTEDLQWGGTVAVFSNGNFIVTWTSCCQDGSGKGVFGQLFDPDGSKIGNEFQVNTYTKWDQNIFSNIIFSNDNFIVIWENWLDGPRAQLFNNESSKVGRELQLNTSIDSIALLDRNIFAITWSYNQNIFVQLFDEEGLKFNNEIQVTPPPIQWNYFRRRPYVSKFDNGSFIVIWAIKYMDDAGIYGQLFSENGTKIRTELQLNIDSESYEKYPRITKLKDGNFVVAWLNAGDLKSSIYSQIFNDLPPFTHTATSSGIDLPFDTKISVWFNRYGKMIGYISGSTLACVFVSCAVFYCIRRKERHYRPLGSYPSSLPLGSPARRAPFSASTPRVPSPSPPKKKKAPAVELASWSESPSASLLHPPESSRASSSSSAASLSRDELQTLLENAHLTSKELTELHQSLQALSMTPKQIATSLTFVQDWEEELLSVAQSERDSRIKTAEQIALFNHPNSSVGDYYEVLWARISDTLLACKTMHSDLVRKDFINKFDRVHRVMDTMSRGLQRTGDILGGEIRYVGATHVLSIVLDFFSGPAKERAVQNISMLVREIREIDTLAEEIARLLTTAKMRQLVTMTAGLQTSWKDRLKKRWQTFRASECTTEAKKLAMQDAMLILKAVATDKTGALKKPNLIDKLIRCALPSFQRSTDAFSDSKTGREVSSSAPLSPEEQHAMSERLKRMEAQVRGLQHKVAGKEDKYDGESEGSQILVQSSSDHRIRGAIASMEREMALFRVGLFGVSANLDHIAAELGVHPLPSDIAPRENQDREELLESEEEDLR